MVQDLNTVRGTVKGDWISQSARPSLSGSALRDCSLNAYIISTNNLDPDSRTMITALIGS